MRICRLWQLLHSSFPLLSSSHSLALTWHVFSSFLCRGYSLVTLYSGAPSEYWRHTTVKAKVDRPCWFLQAAFQVQLRNRYAPSSSDCLQECVTCWLEQESPIESWQLKTQVDQIGEWGGKAVGRWKTYRSVIFSLCGIRLGSRYLEKNTEQCFHFFLHHCFHNAEYRN